MRKADFSCEIWYNIVNLFVNWGKLFRKQETLIFPPRHTSGKMRQCRILVPALVVYQSEPDGEVVCFLNIGILPEQDAGAYAL